MYTTIRFDKQKHSGVCSGCDSGHRPMSPDTWTPPEPCPQCGYSDKMEDKKLLERYKVLVWNDCLGPRSRYGPVLSSELESVEKAIYGLNSDLLNA